VDVVKLIAVVLAVALAGLVAAATGWVVGGLAWLAVEAWRGTQ